MFTFKALKPARKMWSSSGKATPKRPAKRLWLEALEERTLPSASAPDSLITVASSPATPAVTAILSYMDEAMAQETQLFAAVQQNVSNAIDKEIQVFGQEIAQEAYFFAEELGSMLGVIFDVPSSSQDTAVTQASTGATTTVHDSPNPALSTTPPMSGSGSGSGSSGAGHT